MRESKISNSLKIGIALGGGGARGLTHIGVLRELEKNNFKPNLIAGTSVGAIIGAMYSATLDTHWVENRIKNFINSDEFKIIGLNRINSKTEDDYSFLQMATEFVKKTIQINIVNERLGLLKSDRLKDALRYLLPVRKFSDLKLPFSCSSVDLHTGKDIIFKDGNLLDAVLASSAIPGYIQPIKYKDMLLTDGGVSRPIPAQMVIDNGSEFTIGVSADIQKFNPINNLNLIQILGRTEQITTKKLSKFNNKILDVFLEPDTLNLFWGDFSKIDVLIKNGENKVIENLEMIKYTYNKKTGFINKIQKIFQNTKPKMERNN